jgi:uncharacterized protein YjbJ (UPF0337 family)
MNADQMNGAWNVLKGKIQAKWGELTSDDMAVIEGDRKQLAGRIQQRYGYTKEQAQKQFDDWSNTL